MDQSESIITLSLIRVIYMASLMLFVIEKVSYNVAGFDSMI